MQSKETGVTPLNAAECGPRAKTPRTTNCETLASNKRCLPQEFLL